MRDVLVSTLGGEEYHFEITHEEVSLLHSHPLWQLKYPKAEDLIEAIRVRYPDFEPALYQLVAEHNSPLRPTLPYL